MSKVICELTKEELDEIQNFYERKMALESLTKLSSVTSNDELLQKLVADYGATLRLFHEWWQRYSEKYKWEQGNKWSVDFENSTVVLD